MDFNQLANRILGFISSFMPIVGSVLAISCLLLGIGMIVLPEEYSQKAKKVAFVMFVGAVVSFSASGIANAIQSGLGF